jgi:hypothetical protein
MTLAGQSAVKGLVCSQGRTAKTKAELRAMLAEAVRNTQPEPERPPKNQERSRLAVALGQLFGPLKQHPLGLRFRTLLEFGFDLFDQGCLWRLSFKGGVDGARPPILSRLVQFGPHAKAAKGSLDGSCVAFLRGGALRQSVIERGASSCLDALPQLGGGCVASVPGQRSPIVVKCEWRRC